MNDTLTSKVLIDRLFTLLDDWRNLPAYQLERRADIFFAIYLDKIIKAKFDDVITTIIPEFPVRVGAVYPHLSHVNKSFKIDYVAVCEEAGRVYFIELKTDKGSRREQQDKYLLKAQEIKISGLIEGVIQIYAATSSKIKYANLIKKFENLGWLDKDSTAICNVRKDYEIRVVYIQPENPEKDANIISFDDVSDLLSDLEDDLSKRFIKSLREWKHDPNQDNILFKY